MDRVSVAADMRRFLGFAFAKADFLFEIDGDGRVLYASGAGHDLPQQGKIEGLAAKTLFEPADATRFATAMLDLRDGTRTSLNLKLIGGTAVKLGAFRLPGNEGRISCALTMDGAAPLAVPGKDAKTGLSDRQGFLDLALTKLSENDALTLVNVPGLPQICAAMAPEQSDALLSAIGRSLSESGAKVTARLSETSFGALSDPGQGPLSHIPQMRAAMRAHGAPASEIQESQVAVKGGLRPEQRILALRYVVEQFTGPGRKQGIAKDLGQAFESMMDDTTKRLMTLTGTVAAGDFQLAYMPICHLKTGKLSHFEALARFGSHHTQDTISFVEKLGIADSFDLAVALKVIEMLETDKSHDAEIAFNVSGHTIQTPASFAMLAGFLAKRRKLAKRLLIEITETAQITDLEAGAKAIAALRAMGYRVGLDDFGAGAATLNYLHAFQVDFVKFDGSLVKKLGASARDDTLLTTMIKLCGELGFTTIAEYIETEADITKARAAGFDYGQGYAFGAAGAIPAGAGRAYTPTQKRQGVRESWE